jgi:quinol-cytochrome oxidoreductase complex cytochrome b subunit
MSDRTVSEPAADSPDSPGGADSAGSESRSWTGRLRRRAVAALPPEKALPDRQPAYVSSWVYVFGVVTLAALMVVIVTGLLLVLEGPWWYHTSNVGHFVNSLHLWSVEVFFFAMVLHLWGKFAMSAWRGRRALTWITGALAFLGSIGTAFTGYLVQTNFDSQWISTQAKDGLNSVGVGAWFNVLNTGQMLLWHVTLLPLLVGVLTVLHLLLVRRRGVVPPVEVGETRIDLGEAPAAPAQVPADADGGSRP